jgi:Gpi18-like mannosyltransferase
MAAGSERRGAVPTARVRAWARGLAGFARTAEGRRLGLIILAAALLRLALLQTTAHLTDVFTDEFTFKRHVALIHERGLIETFRDTNTSYVFYHYTLWLLSMPYGWLGGSFDTSSASLRALIKIPPLLLDLALVAMVYAVAPSLWPKERATWAPAALAALVAFHPVVVYDSAVWAQIDAVVAISALGAIAFAARGNPAAACAMLAFGLLNKPQPVIFVPVVAALIYRTSGARGLARGAAMGLVLMVVPVLPWLVAGDASRLVHVYRKLFASGGGNVTALTQNAWNLWWFIPFEKVPQAKDVMATLGGVELTYQRFSLALSALAALAAVAYTWRFPSVRGALVAASYVAVAFYVLPTSTHERYMYPMVALLAPVLLVERRYRYVYAVLSLTLFANMFLVAPPVASWSRRWDDALLTHYVAGVNVAVFAAYSWMLLSDLISARGADHASV